MTENVEIYGLATREFRNFNATEMPTTPRIRTDLTAMGFGCEKRDMIDFWKATTLLDNAIEGSQNGRFL